MEMFCVTHCSLNWVNFKTGLLIIDVIYSICSSKEVSRQNLIHDSSHSEVLGEGVFGVCLKKLYRGITVAVKQFKENVPLSLVKHEASILAKMDHPGSHQLEYSTDK